MYNKQTHSFYHNQYILSSWTSQSEEAINDVLLTHNHTFYFPKKNPGKKTHFSSRSLISKFQHLSKIGDFHGYTFQNGRFGSSGTSDLMKNPDFQNGDMMSLVVESCQLVHSVEINQFFVE